MFHLALMLLVYDDNSSHKYEYLQVHRNHSNLIRRLRLDKS